MGSFKDFVFVEEVLNEFNSTAPFMQSTKYEKKPWSAKKSEILQMWRNVRPDVPIFLEPISEKPQGSDRTNYGEDGIRITGSFNFITSVLSRLKEIITYENPDTKLRLVFRGIDKAKDARPDRQSFAFYVNLERRGKNKRRRNIIRPNVVPQIQLPRT